MADTAAAQVVTFSVGPLRVALPAEIVLEIAPPVLATRIPGVEPSVLGVVNVRGSLLTLLDGYRILGQTADPSEDRAMLVVTVDGRRAALLVGSVGAVTGLVGTAAPKTAVAGVDPALIREVVGVGDARLIVLEARAVLAPVLGGRNTGSAASAAQSVETPERSGGSR